MPSDMAAVARGLDLLNRADPLAEVTLQPSGEHVLGAAGPATMSQPLMSPSQISAPTIPMILISCRLTTNAANCLVSQPRRPLVLLHCALVLAHVGSHAVVEAR